MSQHIHISVVTPVYGCASSLETLYSRLVHTLTKLTDQFEIIMVNDASPDDAWDKISALCEKDDRVKGISLSRNFGQHRAIAAGLDYVRGEWTVVMDCDLQDKPEEIIKLYNTGRKGYEIVFGKRVVRQDSWFKRLESRIFFSVYNYFTGNRTDDTIANFSIISKKVVLQLRKFRERNRPYALMVNWVGFKRKDIEIEHGPRDTGKSSYTFRKLLDLAIDIIISHSNKPLKLSIKFGFFMSFISLLYAVRLVVNYYIYGVSVEGWTSVVVSIFFLSGLLFANLGVVGLYIGNIYDEVKDRPFYIIEQTTFVDETSL